MLKLRLMRLQGLPEATSWSQHLEYSPGLWPVTERSPPDLGAAFQAALGSEAWFCTFYWLAQKEEVQIGRNEEQQVEKHI